MNMYRCCCRFSTGGSGIDGELVAGVIGVVVVEIGGAGAVCELGTMRALLPCRYGLPVTVKTAVALQLE